jgi:hypothetical protein
MLSACAESMIVSAPPAASMILSVPFDLFLRETSQSPGTLILLGRNLQEPRNPCPFGGKLLKSGNLYCGPTINHGSTIDYRPTTNLQQRNQNTATIGHGGVDTPLTICSECGKTLPPLVADQSALPLRRC